MNIALRDGRLGPRAKLMIVCSGGVAGLGGELQAMLQTAWDGQIMLESLPDDNQARCGEMLGEILSKFQPTLLLPCLTRGNMAMSETVFEAVRKSRRELPVIPVLENAEPEQLHRLIKMGAADFCLAPLRLEDILTRIARWSAWVPTENTLAHQLGKCLGLKQFLGESPAFLQAIHTIPKLARSDACVYITGETGTGKEMCARAIHHLGPRADHPFVPVNCGAMPSELVENELFGHAAGAFTSAASAATGLVREAEGGTLFLDEIDSLPLQTQVKLLRFLQDQEYRPLGASRAVRADIRIIAASNINLEEAVRARRFRSDLFYRLNVLPLSLPALRYRREDIPLLAHYFISKSASENSTLVKHLSRPALDKLLAYDWPGNVRELENIIERAVVLSEQPFITAGDICLHVPAADPEQMSFNELKRRTIVEFETGYIRRQLAANMGNISRAAKSAKKNRRAFWQLMRKYRITAPVAVKGD